MGRLLYCLYRTTKNVGLGDAADSLVEIGICRTGDSKALKDIERFLIGTDPRAGGSLIKGNLEEYWMAGAIKGGGRMSYRYCESSLSS